MRYTTKDAIRSELLLINEMRTTTKRKDMFELVDNFFKNKWCPMTKLVGSTTDGAPAMLDRKSEFQAWVKTVFPSSVPASYTDLLSLLNFNLPV